MLPTSVLKLIQLRLEDYSLYMSSIPKLLAALKQTVFGPFEQEGTHYLYFRLLTVTPPSNRAENDATVAYLKKPPDQKRHHPGAFN